MSNEIFDIAPTPLMFPFTSTLGSKLGSFKTVQSVVTVKLKLILAMTSLGSLGIGSVPNSQTIKPLFPAVGGTIIGGE